MWLNMKYDVNISFFQQHDVNMWLNTKYLSQRSQPATLTRTSDRSTLLPLVSSCLRNLGENVFLSHILTQSHIFSHILTCLQNQGAIRYIFSENMKHKKVLLFRDMLGPKPVFRPKIPSTTSDTSDIDIGNIDVD